MLSERKKTVSFENFEDDFEDDLKTSYLRGVLDK